jgi:hypothetical protein
MLAFDRNIFIFSRPAWRPEGMGRVSNFNQPYMEDGLPAIWIITECVK